MTGIKRHFLKVGALLAAVLAFGAASAVSTPAAAQELQITGPLAGAPSVRKLRLYRQNRFEVAIGAGLPLLFEYERPFFLAGRLQYNLFDWLGIGVFGGYALVNFDTDLTDQINTNAPRNSRTAINIPPRGAKYADQTGKLTYMAVPQVTFSPFRGKLAVFQKLFIDTDLYLHGGVAFVGVKERKDCALGQCTLPGSFAADTRTALAPSFGLGLTLYTAGFVSVNAEYRAYPFSWNRGGFDSRGGGPDASFPDNKIDKEDRTFKFNQMVFIGAGFYLPTKPTISE